MQQSSLPQEVRRTPARGPDEQDLGRYRHHSDPCIDYCIEVESLQSRVFDYIHGISKPGTRLEDIQVLAEDMGRAFDFRVGGDAGCVDARFELNKLYDQFLPVYKASIHA